MLNNDYSCFDLFKFYYNVKLEYKPKKRNLQIPLVFLLCTFSALLIMNGLLVPYDIWMYLVEGVLLGSMLILYFTLLMKPKT